MEIVIGTTAYRIAGNIPIVPFSFLGVRPLAVHLGGVTRVSLSVLDRSGAVALSIVDNVFEFTPSRLWDVRLTGKRLRVNFGKRQIFLSAELDGSSIHFTDLKFAIARVPVVVSKRGVQFPLMNWRLSGGTFIAESPPPEFSFFSMGEDTDATMWNVPTLQATSHQVAWDLAMRCAK